MTLHPHLKSAKKMLEKNNFSVQVRDECILEVALEVYDQPFAYLVVEEETFNGVILSVATNFPHSNLIAGFVINLMHVVNVGLGEGFYIDEAGETFWGEEAEKLSHVQNASLDLLDSLDPNSLKH